MDLNGSAFKISLGVLKFYGIYQPEITKWSIRRGIFMISFINLQFLIASLINVFYIKNFDELIVAVTYVIFSLNLTFRLISFKLMEKEVIDLINELDDNDHDEPEIIKGNRGIIKLMGSLLVSDLSIGLSLTLSIVFLATKKIFTVPQLYYPENDVIYRMMFVVHYLEIVGIGSMSHGE